MEQVHQTIQQLNQKISSEEIPNWKDLSEEEIKILPLFAMNFII